jgi:hypothetical protein
VPFDGGESMIDAFLADLSTQTCVRGRDEKDTSLDLTDIEQALEDADEKNLFPPRRQAR